VQNYKQTFHKQFTSLVILRIFVDSQITYLLLLEGYLALVLEGVTLTFRYADFILLTSVEQIFNMWWSDDVPSMSKCANTQIMFGVL
jgi:hypothetical protein